MNEENGKLGKNKQKRKKIMKQPYKEPSDSIFP